MSIKLREGFKNKVLNSGFWLKLQDGVKSGPGAYYLVDFFLLQSS